MASNSDRDMVAKLMGDYLLKGFTMLDQNCETCLSPLMRRRDDDAFCVYCREMAKNVAVDEEKNSHRHHDDQRSSTSTKKEATPLPTLENEINKDIDYAARDVIKACTVQLRNAASRLRQPPDTVGFDIDECLKWGQLIKSLLDTLQQAKNIMIHKS